MWLAILLKTASVVKGRIAFPNFADVASAGHADVKDSAQSITEQSPAECRSYQPALLLSTQTVTRPSSAIPDPDSSRGT